MMEIMLVIPKSAEMKNYMNSDVKNKYVKDLPMRVSHPLTSSFCMVNIKLKGSVALNAKERSCSNNRIVQNALKTHGTLIRCHSFSTRADSPKFSAKFTACLYPFMRVLNISTDALTHGDA